MTTGDTGAIALGIGGFNSRQAVLAGSSAHRAALAVREKALAIASHLLEAAADDLELVGRRGACAGPRPRCSCALAEIARARAGTAGLRAAGRHRAGPRGERTHVMIDAMAYANGTAVAEVEVDPETGHVTILRLVIAHDCGRMINPMIVDGPDRAAARRTASATRSSNGWGSMRRRSR